MKATVPGGRQRTTSPRHAQVGPHFHVENDPGPEQTGTRLTVILPVYNESGLILRSVENVLDYASKHPEYRFVFVDDGSTDETVKLLRSRLEEGNDQAVSFLALPRNRGKGHAIKTTLGLTQSPYVCFTDGDLAYSLDYLPVLENALETHDLAIGSRSLPGGSRNQAGVIRSRKLLGWAFNAMVRLSLGLPFRDTQAGLKGFRADVAEHLFEVQRIHGFGFDAEILFLAKKYGYRVAEFPVEVRSDHSYKNAKIALFKTAFRMLTEVIDIRTNQVLGRYRLKAPLNEVR